MIARTRTRRLSALWRSTHAVLSAPACGNFACTDWTCATMAPSATEEVLGTVASESCAWLAIVLAILPSSGCNSEWCVRRQCTHRDLLGHFVVKWPGRKQMKQTRFSRARVLRCSTDNDRNFSHFAKLCESAQLTQFWIDTLWTKE